VNGGIVLTCDAANSCGRMNLLVRDGRIVDITPAGRSFTSLYPNAEVVDASNHLITPGFVNAHFHPESVFLHPLTDSKPFSSWPDLTRFREVTGGLSASASPDDIEVVYRGAMLSLLNEGTTTVGIYPLGYGEDSFLAAREVPGGMGLKTVTVLQTWEQVTASKGMPQEEHRISIGLGGEDNYTVYSFENLIRTSHEMTCPLTAHIAESRRDVELLTQRFKKSPLRILREAGALSGETQLLHCNHLPCTDIKAVEESSGTITLCVGSAAAKRTGYPLLKCLAKHDVRLSLGTDWGSANMIGELQFLEQLPLFYGGVPSYSPLELLRMATINGAHALGLSSQTGSLEVGKKADLLMFALDDPEIPSFESSCSAEFLAEIVAGRKKAARLTHVLADGIWRVIDREFQGDRDAILGRFRQLQAELVRPGQDRDSSSIHASRDAAPLLHSSGKTAESHFLGQGNSEQEKEETPRSANLTLPKAREEEQAPQVQRKIRKVFGENDF
jgi:5-methylthioadenosine/S-adenosylhomocysteine deaminase